MSDSQKFKTVASFVDKTQADLCAAMLSDNDVPAGVFGSDSSFPSLGYAHPYEVKVNEDNYEAAMSILAAADKAE